MGIMDNTTVRVTESTIDVNVRICGKLMESNNNINGRSAEASGDSVTIRDIMRFVGIERLGTIILNGAMVTADMYDTPLEDLPRFANGGRNMLSVIFKYVSE